MAADLTKCPACGAYPLIPASEERVYGIAGIRLFKDGEGFGAEWAGETEIIWESALTMDYFCRDCEEDLPEEYQKELDRLLNNDTREER